MQESRGTSLLKQPAGASACRSWVGGLSMVLSIAFAPALACAAEPPPMPPAASAPAMAGPVTVEGAWVRATVKGQTATGGFMTLRARQNLTLVGLRSPQAPHAELHEMAMDGDIMRMRAVEALSLPAGKDVALRPGGHHLMLMGLTAPLGAGQLVTLELLLKDEQGKALVQTIEVPVGRAAPARGRDGMGGMPDEKGMPGHHHH